jgi:DUF218 domain
MRVRGGAASAATCEGHGENPHERDPSRRTTALVKKCLRLRRPTHTLPTLIRRRLVWLPTLWGVSLMCVVISMLALAAARHLGGYLALNEPALGRDGKGARTLVVEGWLDESELNEAIVAFRRGRYERIVTSGGPIDSWQEGVIWPTFAERAANYLKRHGVADAAVVAVPAPASAQDRTFLSAVVVRDWTRGLEPPADAIDLFSSGPHARRSRLAYRMAFGPEVAIGVLAAAPRRYDVAHWWRTSEGAKAVLGELLSLGWTRCCFWPGPPGSHEERWAAPPASP